MLGTPPVMTRIGSPECVSTAWIILRKDMRAASPRCPLTAPVVTRAVRIS